MRAHAAWLVMLPITVAGIEAAHALANALFGSPEGPGELFANAGSGADLAPGLVGLALGLVLVGLGARVAGARGFSDDRRANRLALTLLPVLGFVALESLEGVLNRGAVPWHEFAEPTFLVGLALQVPFAGAGWLIARLLLRAGDAVRSLIVRRRAWPRRAARPASVRPPAGDRPRPTPHRSACQGRAPPCLLLSG